MTDIVVTISIHGRDYRYRREQPTVFEFCMSCLSGVVNLLYTLW